MSRSIEGDFRPGRGYYVPVKIAFLVLRQGLCLRRLGLPVLAALLGLSPWCAAQQVSMPRIHIIDGPTLFINYCASCHGVHGKGNGPAAPALRVKVPDLTQIKRRSHGQFPRARLRDIIEGANGPVAHGSREMPVWGPLFHQIDADQDLGNVRVENLVNFIESIQK